MICVASLGNILCGDDGIGPEILKELNEIVPVLLFRVRIKII